jgi:SAM-dependent methyltransferase
MTTQPHERACPVCGARDHLPFAAEHIDARRINEFSYASRKTPEFMRLRMVKCNSCDLVYVPLPPSFEQLRVAYKDASYDSSEEAEFAAATYVRILKPWLPEKSARKCALDIGAGNGALLPKLQALGYGTVVGVEPSRSALSMASPAAAPLLREGMFDQKIVQDIVPDLVVSCMTMEHVDDPGAVLEIIHKVLAPGGLVALVVHNRRGLLNRVLGLRSPIMDIEHLQLFSPESMTKLLKRTGFTDIRILPFANRYPLRYWVRLLPISVLIKEKLLSVLKNMEVASLPVSMRVGNMLAIGMKKID